MSTLVVIVTFYVIIISINFKKNIYIYIYGLLSCQKLYKWELVRKDMHENEQERRSNITLETQIKIKEQRLVYLIII